ncbi:MAG: asparagine synthase (glutamine-hydrolyzing) [Proteobacteria bacterium]|nr:asparagine synthase (glutamine-hydrolyzing) [Desulfobulbaceae bacterium]MBU4153153.1 asparagine synthase (glutamine-hydrolyzing) [Pseudomonadota bacterium]
MCGLVGIASHNPQPDSGWLRIARDTLTHRGPDDAGEWWSADGRVGLAHRRLSIMDLTPAGHQPMHLAERGLSIVFNGEIYNFQELRGELKHCGYAFRSYSDTEVLLAAYDAWGTECLSRLNGMFAFALYDGPRGLLFLARDRAGEKPLFYRLDGGALYFASELKALMSHPALPRRIDSAALDCYLAMGFIPGDRCILQGFNKLPPAHAMTFDLRQDTARVWRYWQLPELALQASVGGAVDETVLLDEMEALLEDSVGRQLVADVPVGVLLSGGVDSSLVTAMAVRRSSQVRTFSIGFPGHGKLDETPHARLIARHFGTEHTVLVAEPTTADLIPRLVRQFDEPMVDSSMIPTWLVSSLVRQHCTVALGGDGADELFGGYDHYSRLLWMQQRLPRIRGLLGHEVALAAEYLLPLGFAMSNIRTWLMALGNDLRRDLPSIASFFDPTNRRKLMHGHAGYALEAEDIRCARIPAQANLLQRATRMDFTDYLAEDILVKVDRASMHNSLEVRAPFLDYRLIEFAFGRVPSHLKATVSDKKILLKRLTARVLPPEFDKQRKQGFSIPLDEWLKAGPFRDLFWDTLLCPDCLFDTRTIQGLLKGQDRGLRNGERLFALVQFELWRREYGVGM